MPEEADAPREPLDPRELLERAAKRSLSREHERGAGREPRRGAEERRVVLHRVEPRDAAHEHGVLAGSELGAEPRARRGVRPEALEVDSVLEDAGPGRRDSEGRNLREKRR